ncbi:unnamed protein product [Phytophthora lilii]|uniref:Unnamed protein product n=1 Tax=Phytophthora lilii TaxID=2077276 RepID=A0A9W6WN85_9STRA|nr:unnamed protein product [Phytophthora lilii]
MKFGKRVRSLASPEWATDYVDYKVLKREIKQAFESPETSNSGSVDKRVLWFQSLLESEMQKLNDAHGRILDELVSRELKPLQQALGTRWVLPHALARTLLLDVLQLSHQVDAFRRFVVLNSLALVKIAKKFDKAANAGVAEADEDSDDASATTSRLKAWVLEDLKCQPFYDAAALDALCDETAALTDRVMLCVLPDGNFRLGPRAMTCPICLCADVQVPITLSCAHTFCWSCLSRAAQHRFRSCPLCRRAQSVDPRDYEIDGLVKRFKRAYEFVEQALDVAPLVASPMRQILAEAFDVGNAYLREVEDQCAALAPLPSTTFEEPQSTTITVENLKAEVESKAAIDVSDTKEEKEVQTEEVEVEPPIVFEKGDIVEIFHGEQWNAGVVLQRNEDVGAGETYSVLWWVKDKSQRFGQRTPRHLLRDPQEVPVPPALYDVKDNSGSQEQAGSVGSGSYGSSVGEVVGAKRILHFSDVHLNISDSLDANGSADIPIQYGYDAPITLLTSALEYAQDILPNPDFFLYTGDHAVHGNPSDEYLAEAVKVSVETMSRYFSGSGNGTLSVTAVLGDTDTKNPSVEENPTIEVVSPAWTNLLNSSNIKDLNTRGYLSYKLDEKLLVLTLNTVPYSPKHTPDSSNETDPFSQFAWLNATLAGLRNGNKFAYIAGHIPPIIDAQDGSPMWEASYIATYKKIVTEYADVVKAQIFGHVHSVEFRLPLTNEMESQNPDEVIADDYSDQSSQLVPLFMSAAISPIFYNNPAFMIWDFDPTTYDLLDFTVYGTNLSENNQAVLYWQPLFKASSAYNVSSLSWSEMNRFIADAATDSTLVEQYYYNSQAQSYQQNACENTVCLTWYLCSMMWWSTPEDYTACLAAGSRLESSSSPVTSSSAMTFIFTTLAVLYIWL